MICGVLASLRLRHARRGSFNAAFCVGGELRQEGDCRFGWRIVLQNRWSEQHKNDCAREVRDALHRARLHRGARVIHAAVHFMTLHRMHGTHRSAAAIERAGGQPARHDRNGERQNSEDCSKPSHRGLVMLIPLPKSMQSHAGGRPSASADSGIREQQSLDGCAGTLDSHEVLPIYKIHGSILSHF